MKDELDPGIFRRAQAGDREAFTTVVHHYTKAAYHLAYQMCRRADLAEDLTQEIFLRIYRGLGRYDPARPFTPWFYQVATRVCLNWKRQQKPMKLLQEPDVPAVPPNMPEDYGLLYEAVRELAPEYRLAVEYKYVKDMSIEEIADVMDVPEGTVKTWLFRSREILKARLEESYRVS